MTTSPFPQLRRDLEENVVGFLRTEIRIASKMLSMANSTDNSDHARLLESVQMAIDTVHHFEGRITDWKIVEEFRASVAWLERTILLQEVMKHSVPSVASER